MLTTMSDAQTMTEALTEMAGAVIDEPLDAVQVFYPGGRWNTGATGLRRLARRISGHARLDDSLPTQSVLIVTDTRVIVYTCGTSTGRFALHDLVGAWPRPQVSATKHGVELSTSGANSSALHHHKSFLRLTLHTPDGELVADLPARERATTKVSKALRAA
jgi:hypothetical protein